MSSIAVNGDSAPPASRGAATVIGQRFISALFLVPAVLLAVFAGSPWFDLLIAAAALVMAWEWTHILARGDAPMSGWRHGAWLVSGAVVIGVPCLALIWLRALPGDGLAAVLWLFGAVWATDTAAFFIGRRFGHARLAPKISPGKTWAGLFGALIFAAMWSAAWDIWVQGTGLLPMILLGAAAALTAQAGDLGISWVKRRFGVKDASNLIPGHGGVLDRMDGFLITAPLLAALVAATGKGTVAPW